MLKRISAILSKGKKSKAAGKYNTRRKHSMEKRLGVEIDKDLTFTKHVKTSIGKTRFARDKLGLLIGQTSIAIRQMYSTIKHMPKQVTPVTVN